jgi:predicted aldo/keto reductase-like oxidoreductase
VKRITLGQTGLQVSRVGIGGIPTARPSEDEAIRIVRRALDLGINLIDSAAGYGLSEERFGKALTGRREQVIIATKTNRRDKAACLQQLEQSLRRFKTDYIDLWQMHGVSHPESLEQVLAPGGALEAAQEALQAGKVRHIGVTSHSIDMAVEMVTMGLFETVQAPFHFVNDEAKDILIPLAKEHNVGFLSMKPFAGGHLSDANLVIKYQLQFPNVVPIPGVQAIGEVEEIVRIVEGSWELDTRDLGRMAELRAELGHKFCHWCGYCLPCPEELVIPWIVNARIITNSYGEDYQNHLAEAMENADACVQCGECEEKCPFELPIRELVADSVDYYRSLSV